MTKSCFVLHSLELLFVGYTKVRPAAVHPSLFTFFPYMCVLVSVKVLLNCSVFISLYFFYHCQESYVVACVCW